MFVLTPALRVSRGPLAFAAVIVAAHFLLATGFMLYFFHVPEAIAAAAASVANAKIVEHIVVPTVAAKVAVAAAVGSG